jgi:phenylacetyl-CoA:acceptor oxidoreductase
MGTFPAFLSAWGPVDLSFGSGQGVKCTHSEHLYGELWHRAFTVAADTPNCKYNLSFGANVEASGGVVGVWRHAKARVENHMKRVQFEPHKSVTGACSAEWVPIKPKTDAAFMYAMINVMLHEMPRDRLDYPFLRDHTGSPYLIGPNGFYMRDPETKKPLMWDLSKSAVTPFDSEKADPALDGSFTVSGIEIGADDEIFEHKDITVETAFGHLAKHIAEYTPEWAEKVCDIPEGTVRRITEEFVSSACVGETIEIDGEVLPYRPVAITLGKTVNNGWGGYETCWARTLLPCLLGALEVPGGTLGTTVRLNRPASPRSASVTTNPDGFMAFPMNPTDKEMWQAKPVVRNAHSTLIPLSASSPWSQALGPTHLAWMFTGHGPEEWPEMTYPEMWFVYRTNPSISFWDTKQVTEQVAKFPFICAFSYTLDETNWMADVLLPDRTDLESTQLIRVGGTKFMEQFWDHDGVALRQPAAEPQGETMDMTDIATELASRTGLLESYNSAINRGAGGVPLTGEHYDFSLEPSHKYECDDIWDAVCKSASAELTDGKEQDGLDWYKKNGYRTKPISRLTWYLFPELRRQKIRFEMPFQERLFRVGLELGHRLHENGITWWDHQLTEYQSLPKFDDPAHYWEEVAVENGENPDDTPFWLMTTRSMQYSWGANVSIQLIKEVSSNVLGHRSVMINTGRARELGIEEGDIIEVFSNVNTTQGPAELRQGIRPDCLLIIGQFNHWATPYAKDFKAPSMNALVPMSLTLTDSTGSAADLVKVGVRLVEKAK